MNPDYAFCQWSACMRRATFFMRLAADSVLAREDDLASEQIRISRFASQCAEYYRPYLVPERKAETR